MIDRSNAVGAVLVVVLVTIAVVAVYSAYDSDRVRFTIVQYGEGDTDPAPGEYSTKRGEVLTVSMTAADGWALTEVTVNDRSVWFQDGSVTVVLDGDSLIEVYFVSGLVVPPDPVEHVFTGSEVVAYLDNEYYTVTGGSAVDAGTYHAVLSLRSPEYCYWPDGSTGDRVVDWTILPRTVSVEDFGTIPVQTYSGGAMEPAMVPLSPLTADDIVSVRYSDNLLPGTAYAHVVTGGNFTGSVTLAFEIARAPVVVSIGDLTKVYGEADPGFDVHITGLVPGEDHVSYALIRAPGEDVGVYALTLQGPVIQGNYDVAFESGTLTILPRTVTVSTGSAEKVYDGTPLVDRTGSVEGVLSGDAYVITVTGTQTDAGTSVNSYLLAWDDPVDAFNYTVIEDLGTLTVDPYVLGVTDFEPVGPMQYTGSQIRPQVVLTQTPLDDGIVLDRDCTVTYGGNVSAGDGAGSVLIEGRCNATGSVTLDFGIYHGLAVYVTRDGSGDTYDDGSRRLSSFTAVDPLYDLDNVSAGKTQYAEMYVVNHSDYLGMRLGVTVTDLVGVPPVSGGQNGLYEGIQLMVQCNGVLEKVTLQEASSGVVQLGTIQTSGDIPMRVTLLVPDTLDGSDVQGSVLDFMLTVCIMPQGGGA